MKKNLVALAALVTVSAFAQTTDGKPGVQIQGLLSGGYQSNSYKGIKVSGFDQNGSGTTQVNIRVLEDLGGGMSAYGRLENDFSVMNNAANQGVIPAYAATSGTTLTTSSTSTLQKSTYGAAGTWGNGELAVGLRGGFGDIAFGALNNSGLNWIVSTVSPVQGTSYGGGYGRTIGADPTMAIVRWANSFRYLSPSFGGFSASFITAAKQNSASTPVAASGIAITNTNFDIGKNNQVGATEFGLKFENGPTKVALVSSRTSLDSFCAGPSSSAGTNLSGSASTSNQPCYTVGALTTNSAIMNGQDNKQTSLAASYQLPNGFLLSGAMQKTQLGQIQNLSSGPQSDRTAGQYQVTYNSGVHTAFVSTGYVKENASANLYNGYTGKFTGLGYNYALSKNTSLVARWETYRDDVRVLGYPTAPHFGSIQGMSTTDNTVIRSMLGIHSAF